MVSYMMRIFRDLLLKKESIHLSLIFTNLLLNQSPFLGSNLIAFCVKTTYLGLNVSIKLLNLLSSLLGLLECELLFGYLLFLRS